MPDLLVRTLEKMACYEVKHQKPCAYCGVPTYRRHRGDRVPQCLRCSIDKACGAAIQMAQHQGPMWEKWGRSMEVFLNREGWGGGGGVKIHDDESLD